MEDEVCFSYFNISWDPSTRDSMLTCGLVLYKVTISPLPDDDNNVKNDAITETSSVFTNLRPNTQYTITVGNANDAGAGINVTRQVTTARKRKALK